MVKLYLKEEERIAKEIGKFSCLYDKGNSNEGYKEKDRKKIHDTKFSFK